jgi:hypothetical protein
MFRNIPDAEAEATVDAAWQQGTRYFDTAPFYGAGLSQTGSWESDAVLWPIYGVSFPMAGCRRPNAGKGTLTPPIVH